jgi:transposase
LDDAKRDEQKVFIHEQLERNLDDAKHGRKQVYFVDAAHFVLQPFLGFLWCFQRFFVYSASGRQRFNVLGALNAMTREVVTITNNSYINALSVCDLLHALAAKHTGEVVTLFLDNARYQKCGLVQALAEQLKIELIYLPAYSPNLNLIERLWRHVKQQVLYSRYYDSFPKFQTAIMDCINGTQSDNRESLRTLFSLKFQIIEKSQILNT